MHELMQRIPILKRLDGSTVDDLWTNRNQTIRDTESRMQKILDQNASGLFNILAQYSRGKKSVKSELADILRGRTSKRVSTKDVCGLVVGASAKWKKDPEWGEAFEPAIAASRKVSVLAIPTRYPPPARVRIRLPGYLRLRTRTSSLTRFDPYLSTTERLQHRAGVPQPGQTHHRHQKTSVMVMTTTRPRTRLALSPSLPRARPRPTSKLCAFVVLTSID